jgi:hypothetical protein
MTDARTQEPHIGHTLSRLLELLDARPYGLNQLYKIISAENPTNASIRRTIGRAVRTARGRAWVDVALIEAVKVIEVTPTGREALARHRAAQT